MSARPLSEPDQLPLFGAGASLDAPAVLGREHGWTWRQVHLAALALADALGDASTVCNLCDSRIGFLIAWIAALRRGCRVTLPPSSGVFDVARVLADGDRVAVTCDAPARLDPGWLGAARCLEVRTAAPPQASDASLAWGTDGSDREIQLFTSGSTGAPQAQLRTLGQLIAGARVLAARLHEELDGGLGSVRRIVCSVPPQHMFGLELSVMLPSVHGIAVVDRRPLLPADVVHACAGGEATLWVATPLHLRALARQADPLPSCAAVVASTMPLAAAVAARTEALVAAPVLEIYGSTETGALALRRTAREDDWRALDTVELTATAEGTRACGRHFPSPRLLGDHIEMRPTGRFVLAGREADMVKIGGRRASLAGLNLLLHDVPGIDDGCFYLPPEVSAQPRLCLIYAGAEMSLAELRRRLHGHLDDAFLPRQRVKVERLPRTASGKLMKTDLDRLYADWRGSAGSDASTTSTFCIAPTHPCLPGHFPGQPIVPGVVLLQRVIDHAQRLSGRAVTSIRQAKFRAALQPGETATVALQPTASAVSFRVSTERAGQITTLATGELLLAAGTGDGS
jgi:acyl-CoA synthetase (AMP-forming)/AMP-acid ligase II